MSDHQIVCTGPGPHDPPNGVLGTSSVKPHGDIRCGAEVCKPAEAPELTRRRSRQQRLDDLRVKARRVAKGEVAFTAGERDSILSALMLDRLDDDGA